MNTPSLKAGTEKVIEHFLAEKLRKIGATGFVLGVSGGIDSAVVLRLAANAIGPEKVMALVLPEEDSSEEDTQDAVELCKGVGVEYRVIDISGVVQALTAAITDRADQKSLANIKARVRMILLYHYAATEGRLVLGTSNKSELLIGYFTKYGDGGADLEPIGDLYKTQVRQLAVALGIPEKIVQKVPTAGLWPGQTDENEIGMKYEDLDSVLMSIELALDVKAASQRTGISESEIERVAKMVRSSSHKRKFPPTVKIGLRTPGLDWREGDEDF
ncbi:TPA: NAD+ synthase [Thermoplasmata archaeon]|nr:NAD+ synthase [Thermoplasmata archaeon]